MLNFGWGFFYNDDSIATISRTLREKVLLSVICGLCEVLKPSGQIDVVSVERLR